jgi:hypothetical protein
MDAGRIVETGGTERHEEIMRIGIIAGVSGLVLTYGVTVGAQTPTPSPSPARECDVPISRPVDTRARILAKPDPKFTKRDRSKYRGREITLRATLCGSGKVTDIVVTGGLSTDADAAAIAAARVIQFTPAEKDGKKVSTPVTLKYFVTD